MELLVTGASGFLGRNFLLAAPREWRITALYHRDAAFRDFLRHHGLEQVRPLRVDLTRPEGLTATGLAGRRFDACLYLAAWVDLPGSERRPRRDLEANQLALLNLLEAVELGRMVFLSSGAVYLGNQGLVNPQTPLGPSLPYAIHKLAAEGYLRFFAQRRGSIGDYAILRFMGAFGPYEPPHKIYTKMLQSFVLGDERHFTIYGDGSNLIDAMYVEDAVRGLRAVLEGPPLNGVLDFGLGAPMSIRELVETTARVFGRQVEIVCQGRTAEEIRFFISPREMEQRFGFRPRISFEEGIRRFAERLPQLERTARREGGEDS